MIKKIIYFLNFFLISLVINGCYVTKTISYNNPAIVWKDSLLLHQNKTLYELKNFEFTGKILTGHLTEFDRSCLNKRDTPFWLQVFIDSDYVLTTNKDTSDFVMIPYYAIDKIEKTRFRIEFALLGIPVFLVLYCTVLYIGLVFGG